MPSTSANLVFSNRKHLVVVPYDVRNKCVVALRQQLLNAGRIELHFGRRCPWFDVIGDIARSCA